MLFVDIFIINDFSFICEDHNEWSYEVHVIHSVCVLVFLKGGLKHLMFKCQCKSIQYGLWQSDGVTNKEINVCPEAYCRSWLRDTLHTHKAWCVWKKNAKVDSDGTLGLHWVWPDVDVRWIGCRWFASPLILFIVHFCWATSHTLLTCVQNYMDVWT